MDHYFNINKIQLDIDSFEFPNNINFNENNYIIFWWKSIALGHVFLEPIVNLNTEEYLKIAVNTIQNTLEFYDTNNLSDNWGIDGYNKNPSEWLSLIDQVLFKHTNIEIPKSVPVTAIICTRNRPDHLKRCLTMLENLICLPEEIIVVDNASDTKLTHEVTSKFKNVTYVMEPIPGLDRARNKGIKSSNMPYVFFLDDDVIIHPYCIFRTWEAFSSSSADALTGLVISYKLQTEAQIIFEKYWSFNKGYIDITYDKSFLSPQNNFVPPVWKIGAGANMAFRKEIFDSIGLFDERLDVGAAGCSGDSEIWYRILYNDLTIKYNPRIVVYHEHRKDIEGLQKQIFYYMRGHSAAALIQHENSSRSNYKKYIFYYKPKIYLKSLIREFPYKNGNFKTLYNEIMGFISGISFYYKNRNK